MANVFTDKGNEKNAPKMSIVDVLRAGKENARAEVKKQITESLIETDAKKEIYRVKAQRAIAKAKRAVANNNPGEKAIACNELKFAYGVYHYMDSLHTAFLTVESQLEMQEMTQEFANVVGRLKSIKLPAANIDFNSITATALKNLGGYDMAGMDEMVRQLIQGSMSASASQTNDRFLEDLISGKATLDAPYSVEPEKLTEAPEKNLENAAEEKKEVTGTDELLALLDQINAGLDHK